MQLTKGLLLIFSSAAGKVVEPAAAQAYIWAEILKPGAAASPETAVGDFVPEERLPLLYPDMPLDGTLHHFARWPALLIRNRARATAGEGVLTEDAVLECFRNR